MMLERKRRIMILKHLLIVALIGNFAVICFAQFGGGDGTQGSPWVVNRPEHLDNVRDHLNDHFIQRDDIDLGVPPWNEEEGWNPIADFGDPFTGSYNGNGYTIDGLFTNRPGTRYQALFGGTGGAVITNLGLTNVNITGGRTVGSLIGIANSTSIIENCFSTGTVTGTDHTGGLIGHHQRSSIVIDSYSTCAVNGGHYTGGLIGALAGTAVVNNCYSTGDVNGNDQTGGIVGRMWHSIIANSYSRSNVTGANNVGGLIGQSRGNSDVSNSYSTGLVTGEITGGFSGNNNDNNPVINCYWDTETSQQQNSPGGGEGRLSAQLIYPHDEQTYIDWDFDEIWVADGARTVNDGYPFLHHQEMPPRLDTPQVTIQLIEDNHRVRISWQPVEDARSYRIYASSEPYIEDWGEALSIVGGDVTQFTTEMTDENNRFFHVIASAAEGP